MKKSYLFTFLSFLFLISCGDSNSDTRDMLLGGWELAQVTGEGTASVDEDGTTTVTDIAVSSGDVNYVITFSEGSYVTAGSYNLTNETIDSNGGKVFEPVSYTNATGSGTYDLDDMEITAEGPFIGVFIVDTNLGVMAGEQTFTIESITAEEVVFSNTQEKNIQRDGAAVTVLLNTRSVWTKK